jgi:hypothetical protein
MKMNVANPRDEFPTLEYFHQDTQSNKCDAQIYAAAKF